MAENHNHNHVAMKSKYDEALSKYNCDVNEAEVAAAVKKIIDTIKGFFNFDVIDFGAN